MKALVGAFNQEKALVGAFSVIVQLHRLIDLQHYSEEGGKLVKSVAGVEALRAELESSQQLVASLRAEVQQKEQIAALAVTGAQVAISHFIIIIIRCDGSSDAISHIFAKNASFLSLSK